MFRFCSTQQVGKKTQSKIILLYLTLLQPRQDDVVKVHYKKNIMWQATAQDGKFTNGKCESAKMMTNAYLMQVIVNQIDVIHNKINISNLTESSIFVSGFYIIKFYENIVSKSHIQPY